MAPVVDAERGIFGVLPDGLAGSGGGGQRDLLLATTVHRVEEGTVDDDAGIAVAEFAAPELLWPGAWPGVCQTFGVGSEVAVGTAELRPF